MPSPARPLARSRHSKVRRVSEGTKRPALHTGISARHTNHSLFPSFCCEVPRATTRRCEFPEALWENSQHLLQGLKRENKSDENFKAHESFRKPDTRNVNSAENLLFKKLFSSKESLKNVITTAHSTTVHKPQRKQSQRVPLSPTNKRLRCERLPPRHHSAHLVNGNH